MGAHVRVEREGGSTRSLSRTLELRRQKYVDDVHVGAFAGGHENGGPHALRKHERRAIDESICSQEPHDVAMLRPVGNLIDRHHDHLALRKGAGRRSESPERSKNRHPEARTDLVHVAVDRRNALALRDDGDGTLSRKRECGKLPVPGVRRRNDDRPWARSASTRGKKLCPRRLGETYRTRTKVPPSRDGQKVEEVRR